MPRIVYDEVFDGAEADPDLIECLIDCLCRHTCRTSNEAILATRSRRPVFWWREGSLPEVMEPIRWAEDRQQPAGGPEYGHSETPTSDVATSLTRRQLTICNADNHLASVTDNQHVVRDCRHLRLSFNETIVTIELHRCQ